MSGSLRGRARDFNWHNAIGFWCAIPLFVIVLGSVVISYPWASAMVYRVVGEEPPAPQRPPGQANVLGRGSNAIAQPRAEPRQRLAADLDALWARAERQVPGWRTITLRLPIGSPTLARCTVLPGRPSPDSRRSVAYSLSVRDWPLHSDVSSHGAPACAAPVVKCRCSIRCLSSDTGPCRNFRTDRA
jgi:hypothetical protein